MKYPWEEAYGPDVATAGISEKLGKISLSCRHIRGAHTIEFYLGQLLASIHSQEAKYNDLHTGNIGILPFGGMVTIDGGGYSRCALNPISMADDFVVPALHYDREKLTAFLCGYNEQAYTLIDPVYPQFSQQLLEALGLREDSIAFDPRPKNNRTFQKEELFAALNTREDAPRATEAVQLARLTTTCLILCSELSLEEQNCFLASLYGVEPGDRAGSVSDFLRLIVEHQHDSEIIDILIPERQLGSFPPNPAACLMFDKVRFKSNYINPLFEKLNSDPEKFRRARRSMVDSCLFLVDHACAANTADGILTSVHLLPCVFNFGAEKSNDAQQYEYLHYKIWWWVNSLPTSRSLSLRRVDATTYEGSLYAIRFFLQAGIFELEFFGSTFYKSRSSNDTTCWFAVLCAIRCFRRALAIGYHVLMFLKSGKVNSGAYLSMIQGVFAYYLHAMKVILTVLGSQPIEYQSALIYWGQTWSLMEENTSWLDECVSVCASPDLTLASLDEVYARGREYFLFEDFHLETIFGTIEFSRQDAYHAERDRAGWKLIRGEKGDQ